MRINKYGIIIALKTKNISIREFVLNGTIAYKSSMRNLLELCEQETVQTMSHKHVHLDCIAKIQLY